MQLFYTKRSPFARKVRLVAEEKGMSDLIDLIEEDLSQKSQSLIVANPLGKIPVLLLEDGTVLYDSKVICEYIDSLSETPRMIPASGLQRFHVLRMEALADGLSEAAVTVVLEHLRPQKDTRADVVEKRMKNVWRIIESLEKDTFLHNSFLSLAHLAVASSLGYIDFRMAELGWRSVAPNLGQWFDGFSERASMKNTLPST